MMWPLRAGDREAAVTEHEPLRPPTGAHTASRLVQVSVELYADLRRFAGAAREPLTCSVPAGATVRELIASLGIPPDEPVVVGVDGALGSPETVLAGGEHVALLTPMQGGSGGGRPGRD
jgi:sulfur carrier protein ThiS